MKQQTYKLWILALGLALCLPAAGMAEPPSKSVIVSGVVKETTQSGFLMQAEDFGEIFWTVNTETVLEGVLAGTPLSPGMFVIARHNGVLTRSLPPQAHAQRLGCYPLKGTVKALYEDSLLLTGDSVFGEVLVSLPASAPHLFPTMPLTIYYDGAMTLSLPAQVSARHMVAPMAEGIILGVRADSFLLDTGEGAFFTVWLTENSLLPEGWESASLPGNKVAVYHDGEKAEGNLTALKIVYLSAPPENDNLATPLPSELPEESILPPEDFASDTPMPMPNPIETPVFHPAETPAPMPSPDVPPEPAESLTPAPEESLPEM